MKKTFIIAIGFLVCGILSAQQVEDYPFRDASLPREERIDDLIGRLTLQEKVAMLQNSSKGVERLGIPDYDWWNEALHGVARSGVATVFPQAIALAASFDVDEQLRTFTVISDEARAKYNQAQREGNYVRYYGLSFWTPNINIFRDPRWGRGQETYGEDPFLTSRLGVAAVKGLQGDNPVYYKTHACAKHFAVHSGPEWNRHEFDVQPTERDLWETYLPAFKALVTEAGVREVMGAYNRIDGAPACGNKKFIQEILRNKWGYEGMVVSDCGAIKDFFRDGGHKTHPDAATAAADAVTTGTDVECGNSYASLVDAVSRGLISEETIDIALRRVLNSRFELGMLDPEELLPWSDMPYSVVASPEHAAQALTAARKSIVLLKNEGNLLPVLPSKVGKIAVIGPNAADSTMMLGNYNGTPTHVVTILDGIKNAYPDAEINYERGCDLVEGFVFVPKGMRNDDPQRPQPIPSSAYTPEAVSALASRAAEADVIFYVGGLSPGLEGEEFKISIDGFRGGDRERIELPEIQTRILKALHATGKPVVFILCSGSAVALSEVEEDYDALLLAWYGGQEGGTAVGEVLSGAYNPSGRLPITFYKSTLQLPDFLDYHMDNRTYRYFDGEPLYPFGYGIGYTTFSYGEPKLSSSKISAGDGVRVKVKLSNTGKVGGDEVVQVYVRRLNDPSAPIKSLKGVARISLKPGKSKTVEIELPSDSFEYYSDEAKDLVVKTGEYEIMVGGSSLDSALKKTNLTIK